MSARRCNLAGLLRQDIVARLALHPANQPLVHQGRQQEPRSIDALAPEQTPQRDRGEPLRGVAGGEYLAPSHPLLREDPPGVVGHDAEVCLSGVVTADFVVQDSGVGQAGAGALLEDLDGDIGGGLGELGGDDLPGSGLRGYPHGRGSLGAGRLGGGFHRGNRGGFFRFVGLCAHDILRGKWRVMNRGSVLLIHIRWGNSRKVGIRVIRL